MSSKINFNSYRIIKAIKKMSGSMPVPLDKVNLSLDELEQLESYGLKIIANEDGKLIIDNSEGENWQVISEKSNETKTEKWLEISDLCIGNSSFDEDTLIYILDIAKKKKITKVFISGNITAGPPELFNKENEKYLIKDLTTSYNQAQKAIDIFKRYPQLEYYAINGDKDREFTKKGQLNPNLFIKKALNEANIKYYHINSNEGNYLINGIVKKSHSFIKPRKNLYTLSYPSEIYLRNQFNSIGANVIHNGVNYKLGAIQFGGSTLYDTYILYSDIHVTISAGFLFNKEGNSIIQTSIPSANFVTAVFKDGEILSYEVTTKRRPNILKKY